MTESIWGSMASVASVSSSEGASNFNELTRPDSGVSVQGEKEVTSSDSIVDVRILGATIGSHVTSGDDDLTFSGADCDVVGSREGRSGQYVNIEILDNESFQGKWSAMTNQRKTGFTNNS